jgi:RHS repeat-associated protein
MANMQKKMIAAGSTQEAKSWLDKQHQVEQRFAELDSRLDAVAKGNKSQRSIALANMKAHIAGLQSAARDREVPTAQFLPTFKMETPPKSVPLPEVKTLPRHMADAGNIAGQSLAILERAQSNLASPPALPSDAATTCGSTDADLAETLDVKKTPEITALAAQLNYSPSRIYQYVYNNIRFEPYYGSLKGSQSTYLSKSGGSTDQASLLIALLRASNIPARYVKGTVQISDSISLGQNGRAPLWLGARSYQAAATILSQGLYPGWKTIQSNSADVGVQFAQVWIEACVPYADYRGTQVDSTGYRWIPLDPSFKDKAYQPGIPTMGSVAFDYSGYMANRLYNGRMLLPFERYEQQVDSWIKTQAPNYGNNTLQDVGYIGTIQPRSVDILPTTLPYKVMSFNPWDGTQSAETAVLPASHIYNLNVSVADGYNNYAPLLPVTSFPIPQIGLQRLTLSFKGKTASDQQLIDTYNNDGNMTDGSDWATYAPCTSGMSPATCSIISMIPISGAAEAEVVPELKLDGISVALGATGNYTLYESKGNQLTLAVTLPEVTNQPINTVTYNNINSRNLHALQIYSHQTSDQLIASRAARLLNAVNATSNPDQGNQEETEGEFLHVVGLKYMRYVSDANKRLGQLDGQSGESGISLGLATAQMKVQYLFDVPFAVYRTGFLVDMPGLSSRSVSLMDGSINWSDFAQVAYNASDYESYVWLENLKLDAVSTVRGLQFAAEQGIQILKLKASDGSWAANKALLTSNSDSSLNYSASTVQSIETNYINKPGATYTITIPRSLIKYNDWKGYVYQAEDNTNYKIGSIINLGAGGYTTNQIDINNNTFTDDFGNLTDSFNLPGAGFTNSMASPSAFISNTGSLANFDSAVVCLANGTVGNGYTPFNTFPCDSHKVNMVTGNEYHAETDFTIKSRGQPIVFKRSYNSRQPSAGWQITPLGYGWTHSYNSFLTFKDQTFGSSKVAADTDSITSSAIWTDGSGSDKYIQITSGTDANGVQVGASFAPPQAFYLTMAKLSDGTYTITQKDGTVYTFQSIAGKVNDVARLTKITDRNNNTLSLSYTGNNITSITDNLAANRVINFGYDGSNRLSQITDWSGRIFKYTYDANGNLATVLNPLAIAGTQPPATYTYYSGGANDHAMKSFVLPRGNGMTYEYYANGKVFREYNKLGETNTFTYNELRRETVMTNTRGNTRHYFFNADGNPVQTTEVNGGIDTKIYDTTNPYLVKSETNELDYTTSYAYDANGNTTQQTLPSGATIGYSYYNAFSSPGLIKDANGNYTVLKYDTHGNLLEKISLRNGVGSGITNPQTYTPAASDIVSRTINTYDANGNVVTIKQVRDFSTSTGPTLTFGYNDPVNGVYGLNLTTIQRDGDRDGNLLSVETDNANLAYDSLGRLLTGIRSNWYDTYFQYDVLDRITTYKDGVGMLRSNTYDANSNLTKTWLSNGTVADVQAFAYDDADRKSSAVYNGRGVTLYQYDAAGNVIQVTNPDGYTLNVDYDEADHPVRAYDQKGNKVESVLDLAGKPRSITDPNGNTVKRNYYDGHKNGWLQSVTGTPSAAFYDYDAAGNVISVADGHGNITLTTYDELNRPVRIVGPILEVNNTRPVKLFSYNALGYLMSVKAGYTSQFGTQPSSDVVTTQMSYTYDDYGHMLTKKDGANKTWTYTYDLFGNVQTAQDPKGQVVSYDWNYGGQLHQRSAPGNVTTYTRNDLGQVKVAASPEVTYTYTYNSEQHVATINDSRGNKTLTYDYTVGGLLNSLKDSDGRTTNFIYDPIGRLTEIWAPSNDSIGFTYDAGGRLLEKRYSNGVLASFTYNTDNTLKQLVNSTNGTVFSQHDYTYDGLGNRQTETTKVGANDPGRSYKYVYDEINRMTGIFDNTNPSNPYPPAIQLVSYDVLNNRSSKTEGGTTLYYIYDATNQLKEVHSGSPSGPLVTSMQYDDNGNMTNRADGSGTTILTYDNLNQLTQVAKPGVPTEMYGYDDSGRRVRKTGVSTINYLYNGDDILAEYGNGWATATASYTQGMGTDDPFLRVAGGIAQFYHQDGLGSVIATTVQNGTVQATERFDAWGNVAASSGSIAQYGYTGREPDATGLMYYRARYYDPTIGRFTQRDPIGLQGGINEYGYVEGNPVNGTDPDGRYVRQILGGVFNTIIGASVTYLTDHNGTTTWQQYSRNAAVDFTVGALTSGAAGLAKGPALGAAITNLPAVRGGIAAVGEVYKGWADGKSNTEITTTSIVAGIVSATGAVGKGVVAVADKFGLKLEGYELKAEVSALLQPKAGTGDTIGALTEKMIGTTPDFGLNLGGAVLGEKLGGEGNVHESGPCPPGK